MTIQSHIQLAPYTTFRCEAIAEYFAEVSTVDELREAVSFARDKGLALRILGGGSNVLVANTVPGVVVRNRIVGRTIKAEADTVLVTFGGGEKWHDAVTWTVENGFCGMENMALIPGTVGAAPIQNIGAYGTEQGSILHSVEVLDVDSGRVYTLSAADCRCGYRDSIFKHELRDRAIITSVSYALTKREHPNTTYRDVELELQAMGVTAPTVQHVYDAVVAIRTRKLPDPLAIGNAGSFFKNPVVSAENCSELQGLYPEMPAFPQNDGTVKLPAAWLIDQCGWKGYRRGPIGVHDKQALVLINMGGGKGADVLQLATDIQASVREKFGIELEREVNVW